MNMPSAQQYLEGGGGGGGLTHPGLSIMKYISFLDIEKSRLWTRM